jgi:hypothetical protein
MHQLSWIPIAARGLLEYEDHPRRIVSPFRTKASHVPLLDGFALAHPARFLLGLYCKLRP